MKLAEDDGERELQRQQEENRVLLQRLQTLERQLAAQNAELVHLREKVPELEEHISRLTPLIPMVAPNLAALLSPAAGPVAFSAGGEGGMVRPPWASDVGGEAGRDVDRDDEAIDSPEKKGRGRPKGSYTPAKMCQHQILRSKCPECRVDRRATFCPHQRPFRMCKECGMKPPTNWKICQHNRHKTDCIECYPSRFCPHKKRKDNCIQCGGASICEHKRQRRQCKICSGCTHGRVKHFCRDCGGSALCAHGRQKSRCTECGGSSICEHKRLRPKCKEPACIEMMRQTRLKREVRNGAIHSSSSSHQNGEGGEGSSSSKPPKGSSANKVPALFYYRNAAGERLGPTAHSKIFEWFQAGLMTGKNEVSIDGNDFVKLSDAIDLKTGKRKSQKSMCQHKRQRRQCKLCSGCPHDRIKRFCKDCGGAGICEHGRLRSRCAECGGSAICPHKRRRDKCKDPECEEEKRLKRIKRLRMAMPGAYPSVQRIEANAPPPPPSTPGGMGVGAMGGMPGGMGPGAMVMATARAPQ